MRMSEHQRRRQGRIDRIVGNVGAKARATAERWRPMVEHCESVLAHLEWLKANPPTPEVLERLRAS